MASSVMELNEEQIKQLIADSTEELKKAVLEDVKRRITQDITWKVADAAQKEVQDFITKEIAAEIRANLMENKAALITAIAQTADTLTKTLRDAMIEHITKKMANQWDRAKVIEALFK